MDVDSDQDKAEKKTRRKKYKYRSESIKGIVKCSPKIPVENLLPGPSLWFNATSNENVELPNKNMNSHWIFESSKRLIAGR